jgi:hypothetical protein
LAKWFQRRRFLEIDQPETRIAYDGHVCERIRKTIGICCFSAKNAALRRKSKKWLAQNRDNVSGWGNKSTRTVVSSPGQRPSERFPSLGVGVFYFIFILEIQIHSNIFKQKLITLVFILFNCQLIISCHNIFD